jgi:hypothetical protein
MEYFKSFNIWVSENKRPGPKSYYTGLSDSTADKRASQIKKQTQMSDDDPGAYKSLPGDSAKTKVSVHTKRFNKLFKETEDFSKTENQLIENKKDNGKSTDRSPLESEELETGVKNKAEETGCPIGIIRAVFRRGMAAWKSGHRPGAGQEQWAYARVNSFLTGGEGTWSGTDADLAKEARAAGFNPKKK